MRDTRRLKTEWDLRSFMDEFRLSLKNTKGDGRAKKLSIATGVLVAPFLEQMAKEITGMFPNINLYIYTIINDYFGDNINRWDFDR